MTSAPSTDFQQLIASARAGNEQAQSEILSACRHYLLYIAGTELDERLRQKLGPSDIVQNTMLNASVGFNQFQGDTEAALRAWLREILSNELATANRLFLKASKRDIRREEPHPPQQRNGRDQVSDPIDPMMTPMSEAIYQEELIALRTAMQRLSAEYREVLMLRNWERLSFTEIGRRLQKSENSVKKLWARAFLCLEMELRMPDEQR